MPLPPRDLSTLHQQLNPALAELHGTFPLSRYVPAVGLFRLYKLAFEGSPLLALLTIPSWLTLACLDDLGADYCIGQALVVAKASAWDRASINTAIANAAAPFLVPMMMPVPTCAAASIAAAATLPGATHVSATLPATHVSATLPAAATQSATRVSTARASAARASDRPSVTSRPLDALPSAVRRCISAAVRDHEGVKLGHFEAVADRLGRLTSAAACKAVLGLGELLRDDADRSDGGIRSKLGASIRQFEPEPV